MAIMLGFYNAVVFSFGNFSNSPDIPFYAYPSRSEEVPQIHAIPQQHEN